MDPAILEVILDSSVVIEAERQRLDVARFLKQVVTRLAHGVHRANSPERRQARRAFLDDLKAALPVYAITSETGELVGKINAETSRKGVVIPFDDLLIGACALERGYGVATSNLRHFQLIPGSTVIPL